MKIFSVLRSAWTTPDVRRKVLITMLVLTVFRIIAHVPLPGVDLAALRDLFSQSQFLGLLNLFSGGALSNFSIVALGLNPYINASIILSLLTMAFPALKELQQEGESGRAKINMYTRWLTIPLAVVQSVSIYFLLRSQGVVTYLSPIVLGVMIITLTAGSLLLVWLGEIIENYGVGSGISILIFAGILSGFPVSIAQIGSAQLGGSDTFSAILFILVAIAIVWGIVIVNESQREVPVQYARRIQGRQLMGTQATHLPLRLNQAGVIPIIFAISLLALPGVVAQVLMNVENTAIASYAERFNVLFNQPFIYSAIYFVLVIGFTYFYTAVQFNPEDVAENLQKQGAFIPGVRPGKNTADYLNQIITRITLAGAIFLGVIAVLPIGMQFLFPTLGSAVSLGGTSLLIVVSVVIEVVKRLEAMLITRGYERFLE